MFCCKISLSTNSAAIGFTPLLSNKTVNGFNSIIENTNSVTFAVIFIKLSYIV